MAVRGNCCDEFPCDIVVPGTKLQQVSEARYLGFVVNDRLRVNKSARDLSKMYVNTSFALDQKISNFHPAYRVLYFDVNHEHPTGNCWQSCNLLQRNLWPLKAADEQQLKFLRLVFKMKKCEPMDVLYHLTGYITLRFRQIKIQLALLSKSKVFPSNLEFFQLECDQVRLEVHLRETIRNRREPSVLVVDQKS